MSLEKLVSKYVSATDHVLENMETAEEPIYVDVENIRETLRLAKAYLNDAKYYRDRKRFGVSLASIAYCEGLLDALRLLGAVKFQWLTKGKIETER